MRVDFYHLQASPLEHALPRLLERALQTEARVVVLAGSEERVEALANQLWTYNPNAWLPHGTARDGFAGDQPVWLTDREENPNSAAILVLTDGMDAAFKGSFSRCLDLFDGADEQAVAAARARWTAAKDAGHELHYWQQTQTGGWAEKSA
ncbi:MAG: DNA polymerase III subunit chi [Rhodospirillaceae bacterium]|nr:DNA polymerase III subunit chi [Rhodospirillaceae bacterium]